MGIKIEYVLILAIGVIISSMFWVKFDSSKVHPRKQNKQLEFTDTMFAEVNTSTTLGVAYSSEGVYQNKVLRLTKPVYHTDNINLLRSDKGIYKGDIVYLEGNVTLNQKEGFDYRAQKAHYVKQTGMLYITSPFVANMKENVVHGKYLKYDSRNKKAFGKMVDAQLRTAEK